MLLEFSVENFRSICRRQTLDLRPTLERNHRGNIVNAGIAKALKVVGIYGPNASGKSNLIRAFQAMESIVRRSATRMNVGDPITPVVPFRLNAKMVEKPSTFEAVVLIDKVVYTYGFSATQMRIHSEWLRVKKPRAKEATWFERSYNDVEQKVGWRFSAPLNRKKDQELLSENTRDNGLVLSRGAELNIEVLKPLYFWFVKHFNLLDMSFPSRRLSHVTAQKVKSDISFRERVVNLLHNADVGIGDIEVSENSRQAPEIPKDAPAELKQFLESLNKLIEAKDTTEIAVKTLHRMSGSSESIAFDLDSDESNGTQRFFSLCYPILGALDDGDLLVIDELDCSMHPSLTRKIVQLFLSEEHNTNGAQLVFVSHDASLMDSKLFRRDQLWLTQKNEDSETEFFSLADIDTPPRKNEAFESRYLEGRYGGVPNFGPDFDSLFVE